MMWPVVACDNPMMSMLTFKTYLIKNYEAICGSRTEKGKFNHIVAQKSQLGEGK